MLWLLAFRRRGGVSGAGIILLAAAATAGLWHHARWRLYAHDDLGLWAPSNAQPVCVEAIAWSTPRRHPAPAPDPLSTMLQGEESELQVEMERVRDGRHWRTASGRAALIVKGRLLGVQSGDCLRIYAMLAAPHVAANPGQGSPATYDRSERRLCRLQADWPACVQVIRPGDRWQFGFWMNWIRDRCDAHLWHYVSHPRAGLSAAVLLGSREQIDRERNEDFMTTGTVHLLAISGLNVGILAYAFWFAGRLGLIGRRTTLLAAMGFVIWYALLTDAQPPVVRAAVLVTVMCLARLGGRQALSFNTLALAGLVVLIINPASLFQAGTQLSFLAVATMACLPAFTATRDHHDDPLQRLIADSRPWPARAARRILATIAQSVVLSTVIWLVALPLVTYRFHLVSPIATVLNPIVCLPMAVALFSGFVVMVSGWFAPPLAAVCGAICDVSLWAMEWSIDQALKLPGNHVWCPAPAKWWVIAFYVGLTLLVVFARGTWKRWVWVFLTAWLALGAWLAFGPGARFHRRDAESLVGTFIAVGHGTSVLVEMPGGETLLYDAGRLGASHTGARPISSVLWSRGITHLDAIVISHADADHFNAVPHLLEQFSVGVIYVSPTMFDGSQPAVAALWEAIDRHGIPVRELSCGDRLCTSQGCDVRILHPPAGGLTGSDNANSIVLLIEYRGRRLLLPGDLEAPGSEELLATPAVDCDVLMAPHHGSIRSNPAGFASWSRPEGVVISGGAGRDSTPVRRAYESAGARVFHTAYDGAVRVTVTGDNLELQAFRRAGFREDD